MGHWSCSDMAVLLVGSKAGGSARDMDFFTSFMYGGRHEYSIHRAFGALAAHPFPGQWLGLSRAFHHQSIWEYHCRYGCCFIEPDEVAQTVHFQGKQTWLPEEHWD